ncbi:hypothetical protein AB4225_06340 [Streptomyces sp. 2RAF24]|uniref:hypothetical protein n=1 Tax=Streptomyces sp. 2RAF24 TaxID=3232997 RepID=UPI003F9C0554
MLRNCDCTACCEACGHEPGCIRFSRERAAALDGVLADPAPAGSFLDYLLGRGLAATGGAL